MRSLLACTCLTPVILIASPAGAERLIQTAVTTPVSTSTATNGAPDTIRISSAGSVKPAGGNAVTIDSNHSVTNEGTIQITGASNAAGIHANAGTAATITNASTGKIILDEDYTATDTDNDGDLDGAFAQGTGRFGIRTAGGFTGNIVNNGEISIEGNQSAGIALGGPLTGTLTTNGTINLLGSDSIGVSAGDISGNVRLAGTIAAKGANAIGAAMDGDIGGALVIQGNIASTGYRATTLPADTSKLDADDLLQGGVAVRIAGNVGGGIIFDVPPADSSTTDTDEDDDGLADASEGSAAITSYGSAAAVQIGSATGDIAIGKVAGNAYNNHGLVNRGGIAGRGLYANVAATGMTIGGLGGDVTIAGGMTNSGTILAASNGANATALRVGAGATVPELRNSGTISAGGGSTTAHQVRAVVIETGATMGAIRNSGTISAESGGEASAAAIVDATGGVTLVENSGTIGARSNSAGTDRAIAIDLRANTSGATVRQTAVAATATAPRIIGNILFGSGNDLLDLADGSAAGTTRFGVGNDRLTMTGDATYTGAIEFGAGDDVMTMAGTTVVDGTLDFAGGGADALTIGGTARFSGTLSNSGALAVTLNGGTLDLDNGGNVALASLTATGESMLTVHIDGAANTNTRYQVAGTASFGAGSTVDVRLANVSEAEGTYTFLTAGTLVGGANIDTNAVALPFLFKSNLVVNQAQNQVGIRIQRKTATELGLNRSQASAYSAIFEVLDNDEEVAGVFLTTRDADTFRRNVRQMLPDHAGGVFESVTQGSRAAARFLADPDAPVADMSGWGLWLQQVAWGTSKSLGDTASYDVSGWGATGGAEFETGGGNFGVQIGFLAGRDADGGTDNEVNGDQYELAGYWRGDWGGFHIHARAAAAHIAFRGRRVFTGDSGGEAVMRTSNGEWNGKLYSLLGGMSYEVEAGRLTLRPAVSFDYYTLDEDGYTETGGGEAFDLIVDGRNSEELAGSATLNVGYMLAGSGTSTTWFKVEAEGGQRKILGGGLASTTARFEGGDDFTLEPEERTSGWVGALRLIGGAPGFRLGGEFNAEEQQGRLALSMRASLNIGF